ncbi:MAG TPA: hopanoid biosynthesis associated radical SAM protein HpnJ [Bryobacteraceae bacterium]|nr:hopanoid biosynthesis associated radical SAM protein HpnJ [Bryobacterales bacterium]HRJ18402.1 hopanoid biosynthesis associated radical SAM protein HpnJ [Bryobacteraceae bacterium]
MRTLFLNPPSFEGFDGGASSRWPATREIESYWYPVWLCYPAGMLPDSKVVDAPPHKITIEQTVAMAKDFELLVLFTSTPGLAVDIQMAEMMKDVNPKLKVCFVGPPVTVEPEKVLGASRAIDFVVRREFDHQIVDFANGKPLEDIPNVSFRRGDGYVHNPEGGYIENLDDLPWVTKVYKRDLDFRRYNVPFLKNPFISLYTSRGCPALCTFCLWPQTHSGHRWRLRSNEDVANEVKWALQNFDGLQEIFFDDDTFNYKGKRTIDLCEKLGPLNFTWSCTSRVTTDYDTLKAMKEAGCRLMIVGYESGDPQILKNIKKGATVDMARRFTENAHKLGLTIHADFIVGLPGESRESIRRTVDFAKELDCETIQVSIAHPYPGTEFYDYAKKNDLIQLNASMTDEGGHQLPTVVYPGLDRAELVDWVERFYGEYYFRPKAAWRVVRKAIFDNKERRRLYKEAREYLALRSKRKKFVADERQASAAANGD